MKATIKGWIHWRKYSWEESPSYVMHTCKFENDPDHVPLFEHTFEVEIPDDFDPIPQKIEILRKEKERIQAAAQIKANNIEMQIQELLCLEHKESA